MPRRRSPRAFSLIGILIAMAIIVVLFVVLMNSVNMAVTGGGSTLRGTARSAADSMYLYALSQSMVVQANDNRGRFLVPSELTGSGDRGEDTTANLFSAMIMDRYTTTRQLISEQEFNPNVFEDDDYDYTLHFPAGNVYWDPAFGADLDVESNVSFAHLVLRGDRLDGWRSFGSSDLPLLGSRGPQDGDLQGMSWTVDDGGRWAGHMIFADGSVRFVDAFTLGADNIFSMETGPDGDDVIITFTLENGSAAPVLQWD